MKIKIFFLLMVVMTVFSACAADPAEQDWKYEYIHEGVSLHEYNGNQTEVIIPETIRGKKVVRIEGIIKNNSDDACTLIPVFPKSVVKVQISKNLSAIGCASFAWCENIESIEIPENITEVDDFAFYGCKTLSNIAIAPNTNVGFKVFAECPKIPSMDAFVFAGIPWRSSQAEVHQRMLSKGYSESSLYSSLANLAGESQQNWWYDGTMFGMSCTVSMHFEGNGLSVVDVHFLDYAARDKISDFLVKKYGADRIAEKQGMKIDIRKLDFDTAIALTQDQMFGGWVLSYFHKSQLAAEKNKNREGDL